MALTRKSLLARGAGLALGAAAVRRRAERAAAAQLDPRSWASVRAQFAIAPGLHHLAGFVLAPHPRPVREAIERHRRGLDADPSATSTSTSPRSRRPCATKRRRYLGAAPDELALTDSTTMGLGLLYGGLRLPAGAEILTTTHDFFATHEALRLAPRGTADASAASGSTAPGRRRRSTRSSPSLTRALTRRTRLVAITWVHSSTGVKLPVRAIADALRGRALLAVDGVHGLGVEADGRPRARLRLPRRGHAQVARGAARDRRRSGRATARGRPRVRRSRRSTAAAASRPGMTPGGYHSFEHRWALADAFAFQRAIGKHRVAERVSTALARRLKAGLARIPGVTARDAARPRASRRGSSASTSAAAPPTTSSSGSSPTTASSRR